MSWSRYFDYHKNSKHHNVVEHVSQKIINENSEKNILELGCGTGRDTLFLIAAGFKVTAVDAELEATDMVRKKCLQQNFYYPQINLITSKFENLTLTRQYNWISANLSLSFINPKNFHAVWSNIIQHIENGGRFSGQLHGNLHAWSADTSMSFFSYSQLRNLFGTMFQIESLAEEASVSGTVQNGNVFWHHWEVVARKKAMSPEKPLTGSLFFRNIKKPSLAFHPLLRTRHNPQILSEKNTTVYYRVGWEIESTKYYVNGIQCKRHEVYTTILEKELYRSKLSIEKKYHFETHSKRVSEFFQEIIFSDGYDRISNSDKKTGNEDINQNSSLALSVDEFIKNINPREEKFALLIDKMLRVVDLFFDAQSNYKENSIDLYKSMSDLMQFFIQQASQFNTPYRDILFNVAVKQSSFLFDMLTYGFSILSEIENKKDNQVPSLDVDVSEIEDKWKEAWTPEWSYAKQSLYMKEYLSVYTRELDRVKTHWLHDMRWSKNATVIYQLKEKFADMKNFLDAMVNNIKHLDVTFNLEKTPQHLSFLNNNLENNTENLSYTNQNANLKR